MRRSRDPNRRITCVRPSPREARICLKILAIVSSATLSVCRVWSEDLPNKSDAPSKERETGASTTWEEPSMFPRETEEGGRPLLRIRQKPVRLEEPSIEPLPSDLGIESSSENAAATFQTDFRNLGYSGSSATGLQSTRDREALLALSQRDVANQPYNIKIGPIPFRMSAGLDIEFTDNTERSNLHKSSDLILLPRIDLTGSVRLTSFASLSLSLGIGYIKYLNHSENDRLLPLAAASLNPEGGIAFNIKIGKFLINVFDRPETPQFQADAVTQRRQTQYQQFSNVAGASILWDMNSRTNATFRYSHSNSFSFGSQASTTDGSSDTFLTSLSCKLSDSLGVGFEAGTSVTKYEERFLNSSTTYHAGPFFNLRASEFLQIQASAGYQGGSYGSGGAVADNSSLGSYYANISISNNLNPHLSHSLSLGHESRNGAFSNSTEVNYIRYQANWSVIRNASLGLYASFEDIQESGGLFAQHLHNFTIGLQTAFLLTKHISIGLAYEFTKRQGDGGNDSLNGNELAFDENRISVHLGYSF